jgi:hypothetical protein
MQKDKDNTKYQGFVEGGAFVFTFATGVLMLWFIVFGYHGTFVDLLILKIIAGLYTYVILRKSIKTFMDNAKNNGR